MLAPLVELFGWVALPLGLYLGAVSRDFALLFLVVAVGYGLLLSVWAVILEATSFRRYRRVSDYLALLGFAVLENFGYRQMTLYFRLQAFWKYYKGVQSWGAMTREGFAPKPPAKP
jgi:hypothetical protein